MGSRHENLQLLTRHAVQRLVDDWSSRVRGIRPWGVWVMLWDEISDDGALDVVQPAVPLRASWFLTASGYTRRHDESALRYRTLRDRRIEPPSPFTSPGADEARPGIGMFDVAPYRDEVSVYAAAYYGPLNAYGLRLALDGQGRRVEHRLWVS